MIKRLTDILARPHDDLIYEVLARLPSLGVCADVGAAAGHKTRMMRLAGGATTSVVAFEPFPGNHPFFHDTTKDLDNVTLIKKAVGDRAGWAEFTVPSTVQGNEPGWEKYAGYSSLGYLKTRRGPVPLKRTVRRLARRLVDGIRLRPAAPAATVIKVESTTLDLELSGKEVDFLKIDVQGTEADVLAGAQQMLKAGKIHIVFAEWSGDPAVPELLARHGFQIFDSTYLVIPKQNKPGPFEKIGFSLINESRLSTGRVAYQMILGTGGATPAEAVRLVQDARLADIWTDLIATDARTSGQVLSVLQGISA